MVKTDKIYIQTPEKVDKSWQNTREKMLQKMVSQCTGTPVKCSTMRSIVCYADLFSTTLHSIFLSFGKLLCNNVCVFAEYFERFFTPVFTFERMLNFNSSRSDDDVDGSDGMIVSRTSSERWSLQ